MNDEGDDIDFEPTEEELREAAALARALDRGGAQEGLPADAFETAAMLRFGSDGGALTKERSDALLEEALRSARPHRPRAHKGPWWRWLLPVGLSTAAAAALIGTLASAGPEPHTTAMRLPAPSSVLLRAQAAAAAGDDPEALDRAMKAHRAAVLGRLAERYER